MDNIIRKRIPLVSSDNQRQTTVVAVNPSSIATYIQNAVDELKVGHFETAFGFLNQAKSIKLPTQGVDFLRAECFLKMNQMYSAKKHYWKSLFFPNNREAENLLTHVTKQLSESTFISC